MMMMWFKPELPLLKSINLTYAFANLVGFACVCVVAYKAYHEFWLPAQKAKLSAANKQPSSIQAETIEIAGTQARFNAGSNANEQAEAEAEAEAEAKIK